MERLVRGMRRRRGGHTRRCLLPSCLDGWMVDDDDDDDDDDDNGEYVWWEEDFLVFLCDVVLKFG